MNIRGSTGYDVNADALVQRYERVRPVEKYHVALHLIPSLSCHMLDIGAGSGVDAAWFASMGHEVYAAEPSPELRQRAIALHPSPRIHWMDDCLPHLRTIAALDLTFGFIAIAGVWTHLDEVERNTAMPMVASLLGPDGVILISLRQGPSPPGRLAFPVSANETVTSAESCGLRTALDLQVESQQPANRTAGVTWTWLAFRREGQLVRT